MKILNLFSGIGGNRTLWNGNYKIIAVEHNKQIANIYQKRFPNDIVIFGDAYEYLEQHYKEFDFIWASPECKTHTKLNKFRDWRIEKRNYNEIIKLPDLRLYSIIIFLKTFFKGKWIVENVIPYYKPLIIPKVKLGRHLFWANFTIPHKDFNQKEYFNEIEKTSEVKGISLDFLKQFYPLTFRLDGTLRDMVNPLIGKYILDLINEKIKLKQLHLVGLNKT